MLKSQTNPTTELIVYILLSYNLDFFSMTLGPNFLTFKTEFKIH